MDSLSYKAKSHFTGEGGIGLLLSIAFPMIVSQGAETVMMFVDRMFLSRLSPVHLAAAMSGGLAMFTMTTFFVGVIGYVTALVAQYYGSKQFSKSGLAAGQGIILAIASYPIILLLTLLIPPLMKVMGHSPQQLALETQYFRILSFGCIIFLLRVAVGSFFSGIGRTRIVMGANLFAMLINIPANYVLIFGKLGVPKLGMAGAAYGTLIGSVAGLAVLAVAYMGPKLREEFGTLAGFRLDRDMFTRLLRFGSPAGTEFFLNLAAFTIFVQRFHAYGENEAAAMTIVFSWDLMAFLPMTGISIGVTSLVGRYVGQKKTELAKRATFSGLKVAWAYSLVMTALFVFCPQILVEFFTRGPQAKQFVGAAPLAISLMRLAAIYVTSDGTALVFGGALRGAGDTKWPMRVSVTLHWTMTGVCFALIELFDASPETVWLVFATMVGLLAASFCLRFLSGRWQGISVIGDDPPTGPQEPTYTEEV